MQYFCFPIISVNVLDLEDLDEPEFSPREAKNTSTPKPGSKKTLTSKQQPNSSSKINSAKNQGEKEKKIKDKKHPSVETEDNDNDLFAKMGLQTVEDLLIDNKIEFTDTDIGTDIEREDDDDEDYPYNNIRRTPSPLRSILSPSPKPEKTPRSGRTPRVRYSLDEVTEIRSRSPSPEVISTASPSKTASVIHTGDEYDDDFESVIKTDDPSETEESVISERLTTARKSFRRNWSSRSESEFNYSDDFMSATESRWASKRREYSLSQRSVDTADSEYSGVYSDTFSEMSESRTDNRRRSKGKRTRYDIQNTFASFRQLL